MTRSAGSPQHGLLPAHTKFEREWIAHEERAAAEEQAAVVVVQRHLPDSNAAVAVAPATAAPVATAAAATAAAAMAEIAKLNCTLGKLLGVEEGRPPAPASMYEHIGRDCAWSGTATLAGHPTTTRSLGRGREHTVEGRQASRTSHHRSTVDPMARTASWTLAHAQREQTCAQHRWHAH
jgi:hypothetical protein